MKNSFSTMCLLFLLLRVTDVQAQRQQSLLFENIQVRYQSAEREAKPNAFLINTPGELEKVLRKLQLTPHPGSIDLTELLEERSLVLVYGGTRPTSGHKLHVLKVVRNRKELVVKSRLFVPGSNCYVPQVVTYPLQVVAIPKTEGVRLTLDLLQSTQDCK